MEILANKQQCNTGAKLLFVARVEFAVYAINYLGRRIEDTVKAPHQFTRRWLLDEVAQSSLHVSRLGGAKMHGAVLPEQLEALFLGSHDVMKGLESKGTWEGVNSHD